MDRTWMDICSDVSRGWEMTVDSILLMSWASAALALAILARIQCKMIGSKVEEYIHSKDAESAVITVADPVTYSTVTLPLLSLRPVNSSVSYNHTFMITGDSPSVKSKPKKKQSHNKDLKSWAMKELKEMDPKCLVLVCSTDNKIHTEYNKVTLAGKTYTKRQWDALISCCDDLRMTKSKSEKPVEPQPLINVEEEIFYTERQE